MAHDPRREDYQRLSLRYALELDGDDPFAASRAFATFGRRFAQNRDSLPQSDADRAFHLVTLATEAIDYRLPFATDAQAEELISRGRALLDEALSLDASCWDALRMRSSAQTSSIDERCWFLAGRVDEVQASCEEERERVIEALGGERGTLGATISMRPYWRWLASMAEQALICGRNHDAVAAAERLLASDPRRRYATISPLRAADDAWITLAEVALAHKRCDFPAAREGLSHLLATYPKCGFALIRQSELPDGEFARLRVQPYGEDEIIIAVSEGIVLLQEGSDRSGRGVLGSWVAKAVSELDPTAADEASRISGGEGVTRQ